jgi:hypothetical protein
MRSRGTLLIATTIIEAGAGVCLLMAPALAMWLLSHVREPSPEAVLLARIAGAGLCALGAACWIARDDQGSRSQLGLLWGMLFYNVTVCAVLAFAGMTMSSIGLLLWPGVALHAAMTAWCLIALIYKTSW